MDPDFYKINFLNSAMVIIRPFAYDSIGNKRVNIEIYNSSNSIVYGPTYNISATGTHYIKVLPGISTEGYSCSRYGISVHTIKKLISQFSIIDSTSTKSAKPDTATSRNMYTNRTIADKTNITIDLFSEYSWVNDTIETTILSPEDFKPLKEERFKIKTFSIQLPDFRYRQQAVDILIPYESSYLNNQSRSSIAAVYQTYPTYDNWIPITNISVDTVKKQIRLPMPPFRFSMFQIYSTSDSTSSITIATPARRNGINVFFNPQRKSIITDLSLPKASNAEFRLFDIQGRCLKKANFIASAGFTTHQFQCESLASGKYILYLKAGTYQIRKTVLLMN
jgi:hypothetical protein